MKNTNTLLILAAGEGTRAEENPFGLKLLTSYKGVTVLENLIDKAGPSDLLIAVRTTNQASTLKDWLQTYLSISARIQVVSTESPFETLFSMLPLVRTKVTTVAVGDGFYSNDFPSQRFISVAELHNSYSSSFYPIEKKQSTFLAFTGVIKEKTDLLLSAVHCYIGENFGEFCKELYLPLLFNTGKWKDVGTAFTTNFADSFFKKTNNVTTVSDSSGVTKFFTCQQDKQSYENSLSTLDESSVGNFVKTPFIPGIVLRHAEPEYSIPSLFKLLPSKYEVEDTYFKSKTQKRLSQSWKTHLGASSKYVEEHSVVSLNYVLDFINTINFSSKSLFEYHGDFTLDNCIVTDKDIVFIDGKKLPVVTEFHETSKMYCSCVYNFPSISSGNFQLIKQNGNYVIDLDKTPSSMSVSMQRLLETEHSKSRLVLGMYLHLICMSATHSNKELGLTLLLEGVRGLLNCKVKS